MPATHTRSAPATLSLEPLESRVLLSCVFEPQQLPNGEGWQVYEPGLGHSRRFDSEAQVQWYTETTAAHHGLLDSAPTQNQLDALLAKNIPIVPFGFDLEDAPFHGSYYSFSVMSVSEHGPQAEDGLGIYLDVVARAWIAERWIVDVLGVHTEHEYVATYNIDVTMSLGTDSFGRRRWKVDRYTVDSGHGAEVRAFQINWNSTTKTTFSGDTWVETSGDSLSRSEFLNTNESFEIFPTRGGSMVLGDISPGHDYLAGGAFDLTGDHFEWSSTSGPASGAMEILACDDQSAPSAAILDEVSVRGRSGDSDNDGLIDWAGRYVGGVEHDERVEVSFAEGTPSSVRFELVSSEHTQVVNDTDGSDGWSFVPALHRLTRDAVIEITVNPGADDEIIHTIDLDIIDPGALAEYAASWDPASREYIFLRELSLGGDDALRADVGGFASQHMTAEDAALLEVQNWEAGVDLRSREELRMSMEPVNRPQLTDYAIITVARGVGGRDLFRYEHRPVIGSGSLSLRFSVTPPPTPFLNASATLGFSGSYEWAFDTLSAGSEAIGGWTETKLSGKVSMEALSASTGYRLLAPLGTTGFAVWGQVKAGVSFAGTVSVGRREVVQPSERSVLWTMSGSLQANVSISFSPVISLVDPTLTGRIPFAKLFNVGVKFSGGVTMGKEISRTFGDNPETTNELEMTLDASLSIVGKFMDWSGSLTLMQLGPAHVFQANDLPDPVLDSLLIEGGRPALVTLESPTLDSAPYLVVQEWDGSRWTDGAVIGNDGRDKFEVDASPLPGGLGLVYSGMTRARGSYGGDAADPQAYLDDIELWWSRDGGQVVRLTSNNSADLSPRLVFSEDGTTGMLVWVRMTGTLADPTSQIMYRLWDGQNFGPEQALTEAGAFGDPQAHRLADGGFAAHWRDGDGNLHSRILRDEWVSLAPLAAVEGVYDTLEIDGVLHAMVAATDPGLGFDGLKLFRYEGGSWIELGELAVAVPGITSLDFRSDGAGNLVVGLTTANGATNAVYSGLVPLDDLGADVFVRADGGEWAPGDVSVLPAGDSRYHLAYGLFPTAMDQTEPPPAEIRRAEGARLATGLHLIDGTPTRQSRVGGISGAAGSLNLIAINENGAFVYERGSDVNGEGAVIDLGVPDAFAADTWTRAGQARYVVLSPGRVQVWIDGALTDLTAQLGGDAIAEHLTVFTARDGRVFLAGFTEAGELVAYIESPGGWAYRNISAEDLAPQGLQTPRFTGKIASYVTRWNGLTIAGIDEFGDIQGVWWSPGLERWTVSNLSAITGAPQSVGNLAVTLTGWGGINLAATTVDGRLRVTWWVPSFGGKWVVSDLTQNADGVGMQLRPETTFGYTTPWGALNFGGIDQTGELVVFWWTPTREQWTPAELSTADSRPVSDLTSFVSTSGETSIVGETEDGDVVRYWWKIGSDGWESELLPV